MKGWLGTAVSVLNRIFQECDKAVIYRCFANKKTTFFQKKWLKIVFLG